jgi:hypothetical protein
MKQLLMAGGKRNKAPVLEFELKSNVRTIFNGQDIAGITHRPSDGALLAVGGIAKAVRSMDGGDTWLDVTYFRNHATLKNYALVDVKSFSGAFSILAGSTPWRAKTVDFSTYYAGHLNSSLLDGPSKCLVNFSANSMHGYSSDKMFTDSVVTAAGAVTTTYPISGTDTTKSKRVDDRYGFLFVKETAAVNTLRLMDNTIINSNSGNITNPIVLTARLAGVGFNQVPQGACYDAYSGTIKVIGKEGRILSMPLHSHGTPELWSIDNSLADSGWGNVRVRDIAVVNGTLVVVGNGSMVATRQADSLTWSVQDLSDITGGLVDLLDIEVTGGRVFITGKNGTLLASVV